MLVAAALAAHAQKTVLQSTTRQVVLELARYVPWQKTTRLTQLRLKLRPVLRYQLVQQCLFGLMPHMGRRTTSHPARAVEVPSNASLRDLLSFSLTVLQVHSKRNFNLNY